MSSRDKAPGEGIMTKIDSVYSKINKVEGEVATIPKDSLSTMELRNSFKDLSRGLLQIKEVLRGIPTHPQMIDLSSIEQSLESIDEHLKKIDLEKIMKLIQQLEERIPNIEPFFEKLEEQHRTILALASKLGIRL